MKRYALHALTISAAIGALAVAAVIPVHADVTGSLATHVAIEPIDVSMETSTLRFDLSTTLEVTASFSGLRTKLHTHWGLAGVEDVILKAEATLGAVTLASESVWGRFSAACQENAGIDETCEALKNDPTPTADRLLFLKERITTRVSLGGFQLHNLTMIEDVAFPQVASSQTHSASMQRFGVGSLVTVEGETLSGVSIRARTGICVSRSPNTVKHHSFPFEVNPDCVDEGAAKPDLGFDFEAFRVEDIPIAPSLTSSAEVVCIRSQACTVDTRLALTNQFPVAFRVPIKVADAFRLSFDDALVSFSQGPATLAFTITPVGTLGMAEFAFSAKLGSPPSPANLSGHVTAIPGIGLADAGLQLTVQRNDLELQITAEFSDGLPATFSKLMVDLGTSVSSLELSSHLSLGLAGMERSGISLALNF